MVCSSSRWRKAGCCARDSALHILWFRPLYSLPSEEEGKRRERRRTAGGGWIHWNTKKKKKRTDPRSDRVLFCCLVLRTMNTLDYQKRRVGGGARNNGDYRIPPPPTPGVQGKWMRMRRRPHNRHGRGEGLGAVPINLFLPLFSAPLTGPISLYRRRKGRGRGTDQPIHDHLILSLPFSHCIYHYQMLSIRSLGPKVFKGPVRYHTTSVVNIYTCAY